MLVEVLRHGPVSRAELARRLRLSTPSLTRLTKPLLAAGLVVEGAPVAGAPGRPASPLTVAADQAYFVGVKLVAAQAYVVLVDLGGQIVADETVRLQSRDPAVVVADVGRAIQAGVRAASASVGRPVALARASVAVGGRVLAGAVVRHNRALGWREVDLRRLAEQAWGLPTEVVNDGFAFISSEYWFGVGRGADSFLVTTVGFGVGCMVASHGEVLEGADGAAGWVEHLPLDPAGPECPYGHRGCAQVLLTTAALESSAATAYGRQVDVVELLRRAGAGEATALGVLERPAYALGLLVATTANLLDPERILVSGEVAGFVPLVRSSFDAGLAERRRRSAVDDITISPLEFSAWARGAAVVALRRWVLDGAPRSAPVLGR